MKIGRILMIVSLGLVWCMLNKSIHPVTFLVGVVLGWGSTALFHSLSPYSVFKLNLWEGVKLLLVFIYEMILANFQIALIILSPRIYIRPGIIEYPLDLKNEGAIVLFANMISLTPGTLSVDISEDKKFIYIHAMIMETPDQLRQDIKRIFEKRIQKMMREA
jgi:multicomponent Na+:H+ antiporter subunit E